MSAATPDQLRTAITEMDRSAQHAFSQIEAIADLALASLEKPDAYSNLERIAHVLIAICDKAMNAEDHINSMAEEVGCNYKDQAMDRRMNARRNAHEATSSEVAA